MVAGLFGQGLNIDVGTQNGSKRVGHRLAIEETFAGRNH
jgi:hypothetical protein